VRELGLDDNQAALLEIAKQPASSAQLRAVKEIAARKRADLVRYVSATPGVMDKKTTDEINALEADIRLKVGIVDRINDALAARRKRLHEIHDKLAVEDALAASSECANDVSLPTTPTQDAVESGALPSTTRDDNRNMQDERAADPKYAPAPEATAAEVAGPLTPPPGDDDIPALLDRRPLSAEDQRAFDMIMAALHSASVVVRERVKAELIRANAWPGSPAEPSSRRDDGDTAGMPNRQTTSALLAHTTGGVDASEAEKAEAAKEAPLGAKPKAADAVDAGIKYSDLQVPGFMTRRARPLVVVRRKRRRPRKASGPFDSSPF
jgi:hypothetical protein